MRTVVLYHLLTEDKAQNEYALVDTRFSMCVSLPAGTYKALGTRAGKTSAWDLALVPVNLSQTRLKSSNGRRNVRHAALLMRTYS